MTRNRNWTHSSQLDDPDWSSEREAELRDVALPIVVEAARARWPEATATLSKCSVGIPDPRGERRVQGWTIKVRQTADMSRAPDFEIRLPIDVEVSQIAADVDAQVWGAR